MNNSMGDGWELKLAEEIFLRQKVQQTHDRNTVTPFGKYPVIDQSKNGQIGFLNQSPDFEASISNPLITFANHTCAVRKMEKPFSVIQNVFPMKSVRNVDIHFAFHIINDAVEPEGYKGHYPKLRETAFWIPPLPEQTKIAAILTSVDDVIEKTQAQIAKLQDLKKATMNELLTRGIGHTKFKDCELGRIPESWEVSSIENITVKMDSGWSPDCLAEPSDLRRWGVLKTTAVTWGGFNIRENKALPDQFEGRNNITLRQGDVLITRAGPTDRVGVVATCDKDYEKIMLSDKLIRIQCDIHKIIPRFLGLWLSSDSFQSSLKSKIVGMASAQSNISQNTLKNELLAIPPKDEQVSIVNAITAISSALLEARKRLKSYARLKKALMNDLLTGKVRVNVN